MSGIEAQATKVGATIQSQANHIKTAAPAFVSSAVMAAETAASIPFEASAGITAVCIGIAEACDGMGSSFLAPIIALGFGFTFVVVSILCQLWPKKSMLLSVASFVSSLLAWILSTLLLGITEGLYKTAQQVKSRTDGSLEHGFIYTGSWVNFILICLHLLSSIGMFIMDIKEYIPYNDGNQYRESNYGGGWRKLQEYETQEKVSHGVQKPESVWRPK